MESRLREGDLLEQSKTKHLILLCGPAFSGKSTLRRRLSADLPGSKYVSLDEINEQRGVRSGGAGLSVEEWAHTLEMAKRITREYLQKSMEVIVDDTFCYRWLREQFRVLGRECDAEVHLLLLQLPKDELLRRIERNQRTKERSGIAADVLEKHLNAFEYPTEDEHPMNAVDEEILSNWIRQIKGQKSGGKGM